MSAEVEDRIRQLLMAKTTSAGLSNALFGPMGLFNKLAKTEEERRAISNTKLFQLARARITQIMRAEIEAERRRIEQICPPPDFSLADTFENTNGVVNPSDTAASNTPTVN